MKPRNREVNIFNMSLLDILCGALGAFCFMMLVLFPYWRPGGANAHETEMNSEAMQKELNQLREQMKSLPNGEQMMQQLNDLQQRLMQSTGQLNRAMQDLEEARKRNAELEMRNPVVYHMAWDADRADVDLYVQWQGVSNKEAMEPPDVNRSQRTHFTGEVRSFCSQGPCSENWMIRDILPNISMNIYYKYMKSNGRQEPVDVYGYFLYNGEFVRLPGVRFTSEKVAERVGTVTFSADYKAVFQPAPKFAEVYQKLLEFDRQKKGTN